MNFVPGEEKEGKMRIIHKEQVAVIDIVIAIVIISAIIIAIVIINTWKKVKTYFIRTESRLSAATECQIMD